MKNNTLNKEQIQFTDNYLQTVDVIFVDVRAEMTDHIASAIEKKMELENLDFHESFRSFMILNKKEILKNNERSFKNFLESILGFSKTLFYSYNLFFGTVLIFYFMFFVEAKILKTIHFVSFFIIMGIAFFQFIYFYLILRKRYLCTENTSFALMAIYFINLLTNGFYNNFHGNSFTVGITIFLLQAYLIDYFLTIKKFRLRYL